MRTLRALLAFVAAVAAVAAGTTPASASQDSYLLVAAAPGYPGSTAQAQPTMDAFAALVAEAAGWPAGRLAAEYHAEEASGVARLREAAQLAIVPFAFFLKYEDELHLRPIVQTVALSGDASERWSLVAGRDRVSGPEGLEGWQLLGVPAYAPAFVLGPLLAHWGVIPVSLEMGFTDNALAALRRAAAGENVAVLLDGAQAEALESLPIAESLEVVTTAPPTIPALVVAVGTTLEAESQETLRSGLLKVHESPRFAEVLTTLRLSRFAPLDATALEGARELYRTAG